MNIFDSPRILRVGEHGTFVEQRAYFLHGMYWIKENGKLHPLYKRLMSRTAFELTNANQDSHQGSLLTKAWVPLSQKMLAWYDMLPDEVNKSGNDSPDQQHK